jgi:hypothetical protein
MSRPFEGAVGAARSRGAGPRRVVVVMTNETTKSDAVIRHISMAGAGFS